MEEQGIIPVPKQNLSDDLARQIKRLIDSGVYGAGDKLPPISEMARMFVVGPPTLREALKKLETLGVVVVRHGSGIYVTEQHDRLFLSNPVATTTANKQVLLDLIETRVPLEILSISRAAERITDEQIATLSELLDRAAEHMPDDALLNATNMAFHREIAAASGNVVLPQILGVMSSLFGNEQQMILRIYGSRRRDHEQHIGILDALKARNKSLAIRRMRHHLAGVKQAIEKWDPEEIPLNGGY